MELMETIKERRSIRRFKPEPLPPEALEQILTAVRWAPSWANTQVWEVIAVTQEGTKESLRETLSKNPSHHAMVEAPVVLVICAKLGSSGYYNGEVTTVKGDWYLFDLGLAAQNLCLAAYDLGLGTVIVGLFDHSRVERLLEVKEGYTVVAMIPVGYPAKEPKAPKRREFQEFLHRERF